MKQRNAALQKQRHDVDIMMRMMRPAKGVLGVEKGPIAAVAADDDVGIQESVRRKRGVSWTEIADRPPKTSLSTDERVAFLRLVKGIRANTIGIKVRDAGGRWAPMDVPSDTCFFYDVLGDLGTFFEPISM